MPCSRPVHSRTAVAAVALIALTCTNARPRAEPAEPAATTRGGALFLRHCAACHGADGSADTPVATLLRPRPNAFQHGLFKLVSTQNGMPSEDDLVATLRRGMPGSTMMAYEWLPEDDLRALAQEVQRLARQGRTTAIERTAALTGRPLTPAQATAVAERELRPGLPVDTGQPREPSPALLAAGEALYQRHCTGCHGQDGRGLPGMHEWPTDGTWLWPRDFTAGYLRGGASQHDLALRIRAGMPGAHMPPTPLATAETEALAAYVANMIPEAAREHHVQWRRTLRVPRSTTLPADGDDAAFARLEAVRLPLAPLHWRAEAPDEVWLRAAHDGRHLVLQLSWADDSKDDRPRAEAPIGDGLAVQFARGMEPPLFAMGSADRPVSTWRWHTFDPKGTAGQLDLVAAPHAGLPGSGLDVPLGTGAPRSSAEAIELTGMHSAGSEVGSGLPLAVATQWRDGRWTATFRRSLRARHRGEVDFVAGTPTLFALAVWNGSLDASAASKAITTWHVLALQD